MLACAVPLIITSFGSSGSTQPVIWVVIGLGAMLLLHWLAMRFMHRGSNDKERENHSSHSNHLLPPDPHNHSSHS